VRAARPDLQDGYRDALAVVRAYLDPDEERQQVDPENGIFWAPPDYWSGKPRRWSRQWYEWREQPRRRKRRS
jgi:hypothetical protein